MFNQHNEEEKKLDWMYKGPNSTVSREEYLLGRPIDKALEQLNDEEKQKQQGLITISKNRVEHECIPPSIRDFNKLVQAEQVDLSTKLQEDPLVAIKKREEETRRQFLQNPVQLKKLQKALKAQQARKKKRKKKSKCSDSESDLDKKLTEKLLGQNNKRISKKERDLDTILIHKYEALKDKLTESDLQDILNGKLTDTDSDDSSVDEKPKKKSQKKRKDSSEESEDERRQKYYRKRENRDYNKNFDSRKNNYREWNKYKKLDNSDYNKEHRRGTSRYRECSHSPHLSSSESNPGRSNYHSRKHDSDESDSSKNKRTNYGLVSSDGKKIPLKGRSNDTKDRSTKTTKAPEPVPQVQKRRAHKLTDEEKEKLRQEMMENAVWRDKERSHNVKMYHEMEEKEKKEQHFDPDFVHKQLLKSANNSSVESRIKSNVNKIQRSSRDMDRHFSRR